MCLDEVGLVLECGFFSFVFLCEYYHEFFLQVAFAFFGEELFANLFRVTYREVIFIVRSPLRFYPTR